MSISETAPLNDLSEREIEILRLVATGVSNKEIAQRLYISPNTVKVHLRNIFAKIGVASRTEATVYAIRNGIVQVEAPIPAPSEPAEDGALESGTEVATPAASIELPTTRILPISPRWRIAIAGIALTIVATLAGFWLRGSEATPPLTVPPPVPTLVRWEEKAPLPTARSGLAAAVYENQIYAIGGEATDGITGVVEHYDPNANRWTTLTPKPVPVADVGAAVVSGLIFVPGGRLASGKLTNLLEVYDPRRDQWERRESLPVALSAYALVAFEGKLYLFGGWDGQHYVASTYEYDPDIDRWLTRTQMPTPRGYAGAAIAAGKIYVIGGTDGERVLTVNEVYVPERERSGENPWQERTPLPAGRKAMGIANVADIIHVVGGENAMQIGRSLKYFPQQDEWQPFELPVANTWSRMGMVVIATNLYAVGGRIGADLTTRQMTYQAIYTIALPVMP